MPSALLVSMCVCVCVCEQGDCGWGQPECSSLVCLGGPEESRALEGVDVSALRDLRASARITLFLWCQVKQ